MSASTTGAKFQQLICALCWMRDDIPSFSAIIRPLHQPLGKIHFRAGKGTKTAVVRFVLSRTGWDNLHDEVFLRCKQALCNQTTLAHFRAEYRTCVYTDALDYIWYGVLAQVPPSDLRYRHVNQRQEPLAFLLDDLKESQISCSVLKKKAFRTLYH